LPQKGAKSSKAIVFYAFFALFRGCSSVLICALSCGFISNGLVPLNLSTKGLARKDVPKAPFAQ
jgi:hypothetical protein